jgi:hypothetical protein
MSFCGFFAFLMVSVYCLYAAPDKFDYNLFSILAGGGAVGSRVIDKWLNIKANQEQKIRVFPPLPGNPPMPTQKG